VISLLLCPGINAFSQLRELSSEGYVGLFLGKRPVERVASVYTYCENAIEARFMSAQAQSPMTQIYFCNFKPMDQHTHVVSDMDDARSPAATVDTNPLVSIIIPCYNGEAFVQEAIMSALGQTYPRVEVLVVDDGSTDRSAEIARAFPVRYLYQKNRGLTASRNRGIQESRGAYVIFLDADDRLLPEAVEAGLQVLQPRAECAMAIGDHLFVGEDGSHLANSRKPCVGEAHYEALLISNFIEMISSVLFRRSVLDEVGGFDLGLRVAEDYELYLRIAREFPVCCHATVVAEYRQHRSNASHNSELMLTMTLQVLKRQARYIFNDLRRLSAYLEGLRTWRKQYGRQLTSELARSFSTAEMSHLRRKILLLADHYPQGLMVLLLLRIMPRLGARKALGWSKNATGETPWLQKLHAGLNASKPQSATQIG
jgi:glycosyltransferase involved in cell wall biosynthesis